MGPEFEWCGYEVESLELDRYFEASGVRYFAAWTPMAKFPLSTDAIGIAMLACPASREEPGALSAVPVPSTGNRPATAVVVLLAENLIGMRTAVQFVLERLSPNQAVAGTQTSLVFEHTQGTVPA